MNLSNGDGDALASVSLSESEEMTPCTVCQKKKGMRPKKKKKKRHLVLSSERRKVCTKKK
jgi:hypothetical protein